MLRVGAQAKFNHNLPKLYGEMKDELDFALTEELPPCQGMQERDAGDPDVC